MPNNNARKPVQTRRQNHNINYKKFINLLKQSPTNNDEPLSMEELYALLAQSRKAPEEKLREPTKNTNTGNIGSLPSEMTKRGGQRRNKRATRRRAH